jgi:hypothetical protein
VRRGGDEKHLGTFLEERRAHEVKGLRRRHCEADSFLEESFMEVGY